MGQCMTVGCCEDATHALKLCVPDAVQDEPAAEGLLSGIWLCEIHALEAEDNEFNPVPALVAQLANVLRFPTAVPVISEAYVTAIPIDGAECKAFRALERATN